MKALGPIALRCLMLVTVVVAPASLQGCSMSLFGSESPRPAVATSQTAAAVDQSSAATPAKVDDILGLDTFDADKDGVLTKAELEAGLLVLFKKTDASGDGSVSSSEVRPLNDTLLSVPNGSPIIDWNADGRIDMPEFASQWRTKFDRADIDRDGVLDERELAGRVRAHKPRELPQPELGKYRGPTG